MAMNWIDKGWMKLAAAITVGAAVAGAYAADWPMWGHDPSRNMVSPETGLVIDFKPGKFKGNTEEIDMATTQNVKWVAKLGSQSYGNPTISGGKVFVGTNNEPGRDKRFKGDYSLLYCFDEKTGELLWQLSVAKLGTGKVSDWEFLGICSSPTIDGNRVYLVTNRCEVLCLDVEGMKNGNDGPFKEESDYISIGLKEKLTAGPTDADIIWRMDLMKDAGVFPHNVTSSSVLVAEDKLYVGTSNGVDWSHTSIPAPKAPALVVLDKKTGELLGEEASGLSSRVLHGNWSSPAYGKVNGKGLVIFGGPDGICYGFDPTPVKDADGLGILKEIWRFDANPAHYRMKDGKPLKYATPNGPSEIISTPVFYKNRVYVPIGQDPEHGEGVGNLVCIDATKTGDITKTGAIWQFDKINRAISTVAIVDGLVLTADFSGFIYCLDAETGELYWKHDSESHIWGSPLVADGKMYIGNEDGDLLIFSVSKAKKLLGKINMDAPIYSSPVAANKSIYIATHTHLYSITDMEKK